MIDLNTATQEQVLAYIQQQQQQIEALKTTKKTSKLDKLTNDIQALFNDYSNNSTDKLLYLHFLLSAVFNNLEIPTLELLDKLDYVPDEEDLKKLAISTIKLLAKELVLRKSKKNVPVAEIVPEVAVDSPL